MYKYEMHCHTAQTSACSRISGSDLIDFYKDAGYTGVVITDHFFNGNTTVPRDLPWRERVELFTEGYRDAKKRGDEIGVDVFFAWEFSLMGTDFLTYGLDVKWLLQNCDCDKMSIRRYCDLVHRDGGYVFQAHPFRQADYIELIRLLPDCVDGVETINACRTDFENRLADQYADNYGLKKICGTDNHIGNLPRLAALELDFKAESLDDIMKAVMDGKHTITLIK